MALLLQITPPSSPSFYNSTKFKFNLNLESNRNHILSLKPPNSLKSSSYCASISTLNSIRPYAQSQWQPIVKAYLCSAVSVYSLSKIVPKMGSFSATMATLNPLRLRDEGLALGALFVVRVVASYLQQSFLCDAALSSVYRIRVDVFERVLGRELGFWEGSDGALAGDVAYRIAAEAIDVADTVYALLNTTIPSVFQLSAMATQMMVISPVLSFVSALMIPLMGLVIAYLSEKLRKISEKANLSIATLSACLNEVLSSILFVKANNAECFERTRFQGLALTDLSARLKKKKMKALVPQIVQIIYFGVLFVICLCSLVSSGSFNSSGVVSFITSLVLLTEPIQTVFSGTVAENIGYRDLMSKIDMEKVEQAARTANADERLAIARALYHDPSILILDEATSALDSRSELLVRQALQRLTENRTVIVIAHRLETVLMADQIYLLNDGKLQELSRSFLLAGQHDSLSSSGLLI